MSSLRDRLIIKVVRLKDFLAHVDRADRIFYVQRGHYLVALASNFLWEGDLSKEDKDVVEKWNKLKEYKGSRSRRVHGCLGGKRLPKSREF
jgi:hypothetical protein